ncbi:ribulokinase [Trueperella pyogenes]|uniref:ribulokinase n=1 Tax=Trueperella pyogenes TaxID=1661 RepID=UPI00043B16B8|nr:ribulokinase [Trueperella pyogenes]AHU90075.1 ribulokinase [Trueperella pyogenes]AWA44122.1 ribulokinase [Trueperella pyogenes]AWG03370.1 ribulokinase [Trueperella pyogenes]AWG16101.1 ribulokinase [Trueperella pyogenes]AZR01573.1 ribulokinase [Trueperella pyogenes]
MTEKYLVGVDFGTLSGRAVVVRASDGFQVGTAVSTYKHAVMDRTLTAGDNQKLPPEFALQNPRDYIDVLANAIPAAIKDAGVRPSDIVGVGIDATSATVFVTDAEGTPLCEKEEFAANPHAYVKLWKHHGAQDQADRIIALAEARGEEWLERYGGILSSEMLFPKILETFEKAPEVYAAADVVVNLLDWVTWKLTGELTFSASDSGYKRMLTDGEYPSREFCEQLAPGFGGVFEEKMNAPIKQLGEQAGVLSAAAAELTGLPEGIAVAAGNIDAHVVVAGANAVKPGQLTAIIGTSGCYILNSEEYRTVPGVFGNVLGGAVAGLWGIEGGQTAVGDVFAWFEGNGVPERYEQAARDAGVSVLEYMMDKAFELEIGEHGLVALDWLNGNRSILSDARLSGAIIGLTLQTRPEDIYRALMEGTVFGIRVIIDNFEEHGVPVTEIVAAGGLLKNHHFMQMLADITRRPVSISEAEQTGALGSAIFAAVAAGVYDDVYAAAEAMSHVTEHKYVPDEEASNKYEELYGIYRELHDFFGRGKNLLMHRLKDIRSRAFDK